MEKQNDSRSTSKGFKIFIAICCIIIAGLVAFVMFGLYDPSLNAIGALSSVCMDVICMMILFILLGSFAFGNYGNKRTTRLYAMLLIATVWAMFLDFLNWAFDGSLTFGNLTYWFTLGSLCMGSVLACIFSLYMYCYMDEMHGLSQMRISARICAILNMVSFVVTLVLALTRTAFDFVDGHYETGVLYDAVTVVPVLTLLYLTGFIIRYVKRVGMHDIFAVVGYILFMVAGALIESEFRIGTTYVAVAIADIYIFVMLQNEIIAQEKRNVETWMVRSNTDELTGFLNRRAYEEAMTELDTSKLAEHFTYISVDVNSLKVVNDSLGHQAGDELLIGAAETLKRCLGAYGDLYRIGGDEFAALIYADDQQLAAIKKDIEEATKNWKGRFSEQLTISCGYVVCKETENLTIRQIAILADKRMYEAKAAYYQTAGIERRKTTGN